MATLQSLAQGESEDVAGGAATMRRAAFASLVGTTVEWYDFYLFVLCSALVFPKVFFSASDPATAYLGSVGTLAIAFLARPIGAFAFGHFGDTHGRKVALVITLVAMGIVTCAIGLVPGYQVGGYWSVLALMGLRLLQGVFFGGEWGGAVLMTVENSPGQRRGWYGVFSQLGNPLGFFIASGVMQLTVVATSLDDFLRWGWRIAFFASALLVLVGLWVRLQVTETRDFRNLSRHKAVRQSVPIKLLFARYWRTLLLCLLLQSGLLFGSYLLIAYGANYSQRALGIPANWIFIAGLAAAVCNMAALMLFARWSDTVGRKPIYMIGLVLYALVPFPFYWLLGMKTLAAVVIANTIVWLAQAGTTAVQSSFLAELFPTEVRYSAISISYQLATAVIGIPVSFLPVWVMAQFGTIYAVAAVSALGGLIGLVALVSLPETFRKPMASRDAVVGELDRLSINTVTTKRWPLRDAIAGYARAGIPAIGLWPHDVHELGVRATRQCLEGHGMAVSSYCCGRMFMARERSEILEQRKRNRALVEEAAELGAACLVCVSGGFPADDADLKAARRRTADELAELLPAARAAGVVLGIEPIHPMRAADVSCITTLAEANALCDALGPGAGVVVDVYHVWWDPNLERELDRAQGRIVGFHLCDWLRTFQDVAVGRGMMGDGVIDIRAIREAVDRRGYKGWHEVEIVSPIWGERDPVEVTRICVERYRANC